MRMAPGRRAAAGKQQPPSPAGVTITNFAATLDAATVGSQVPLYFNVLTTEFGAGEIRGQLVAIADDTDNVVTGTIGDDGRDEAPLGGRNGNDAILSRCGQAGQRMRAVIPSFDLIWDWDHGGQ